MEEGTFAAPPGLAAADAPAPRHKDRTGAVKVAAGLNLALGGLLLLGALGGFIAMSTGIDFLYQEGDWDTARELTTARTIVTSVLALAGTPYVVAGTAVYYRQNWGRVTLMAVSGLGLLLFPIGTLIAVTTFWALTRPGAEPWFGGNP